MTLLWYWSQQRAREQYQSSDRRQHHTPRIGKIGVITTATPANVHEAMCRPLTGGCLPPKESFRGDIFHASKVVAHIQSEAPDDATSERICRAVFSVRGGEMKRTPWMTTMCGQQSITKIVASIEEHASASRCVMWRIFLAVTVRLLRVLMVDGFADSGL